MRYLLIVFLFLFPAILSADCRGLASPRGVPAAEADQWSLATVNLWRLRDSDKDSDLDDPVPPAVLEKRLRAVADFIAGPLQAPQLLALQEVENIGLLKRVVEALRRRGLRYRAVLEEGNDPSGMDVALLYRDPVAVESVSSLFAAQQFHGHPLFSRPPLQVTLSAPWPVQVVVVHLRSARDLRQRRVHEKRQTQSALLANWAKSRGGPLIVAGDFNTTWNAGRFSASYERFQQSGLINVWQTLPKEERYSFRYRCRPQALDHIWVTPGLVERIKGAAVSRGNAGRYDSLYGSDGVSPVSDHDVLTVYFSRED